MTRKKKHEEHANHEAWAIPYGDLITLLLAFFVVMYATSSLNEGKYRVLSHSMVIAFSGKPRAPLPIQIGEVVPVRESKRIMLPLPRDVIDQRMRLSKRVDLPFEVKQSEEVELSGSLEAIAEELERTLEELALEGQIRLQRGENWIEISINADVLFPTARAELSAVATSILQRIARLLQPHPQDLIIEGHTDDVPISTGRYPSNWELSAARAGRVVRLFESSGVDPDRMTLRAYGERRPEASNATAQGRDQNRRVVVIIHQQQPVGRPPRASRPGAAI